MIKKRKGLIALLNELGDHLLRGAIDTHVHGAPDIIRRKLSDLELAAAARKAGMRAVVLKNHVTPTAARAALVQEVQGSSEFRVVGGLVLNKAAGGLNPAAVEAEIAVGARVVWMPTISAVHHLHSRSSGTNVNKAVAVTDEQGRFFPELYDILDMLAQADIVLGTGHLSPAETAKLVGLARERGVRRILVTHPESRLIKMPIEMQAQLAKQGAFFERCFFSLNAPVNLPPQTMVEQIKATEAARSVLATDFGQVDNDYPVAGLRRFITILLQAGITAAEIELMVKKNPAGLLGIQA